MEHLQKDPTTGSYLPLQLTQLQITCSPNPTYLMPKPLEIPGVFEGLDRRNAYVDFIMRWMFGNITQSIVKTAKPRIGIEAEKAWFHLRALFNSGGCSAETKIAAASFLFHEWFELVESE